MKIQTRQFDKHSGAALILVVVVTVLLAVIGTMFLMTSRVSEMETVAVTDDRDLKAAVQTVVGRIDEVLVEDLFGNDSIVVNANLTNFDADESYDYPSHNPALDAVTGFPFTNGADGNPWTGDDISIPGNLDDYWLASLEPVFDSRGPDGIPGNADDNGPDGIRGTGDDAYKWPHITDLWGTLQVRPDSLLNQSFYPTPVRWFDPDSLVDNSQWAYTFTAWDNFRVSAFNVRAKVISPNDRMKVILENATGTTAIPDPWDDKTKTNMFGARADADGDGVADSRWVKVPGLTTSRGKDVFAAVRIIDNCAMLNLNTAHCFYQDSYTSNISPFMTPWYATQADLIGGIPYHDNLSGSGRYLTEINYMPFLRGRDLGSSYDGSTFSDFWYNLMIARNVYNTTTNLPDSPQACQAVAFQIDDPLTAYPFFDIGDELEIRNRYLMSSLTESRFEQVGVAHFSLNADRAAYAPLRVTRELATFDIWKYRIDPIQFERWDNTGTLRTNADPMSPFFYRYDRRHVCTFYSFDRNIQKGQYLLLAADLAASGLTPPQIEDAENILRPKGAVTTNIEDPDSAQPYNNVETRRRILHLLYAMREYYLPANYFSLSAAQRATAKNTAAMKAAQIVANLIDFSDNNSANIGAVTDTQGPFYNAVYGTQANVDCTFITEQMIQNMINEVSGGPLPVIPFGLTATDIVFGYERQPFISEVYVQWDGGATPALQGFAIELVNPYDTEIDIAGWTLQVGTAINHTFVSSAGNPVTTVAAYSGTTGLGRLIIQINSTGTVPGGTFGYNIAGINWATLQTELGTASIDLLKPPPPTAGATSLIVDNVANADLNNIIGYSAPLGGPGNNVLKRDDNDWKFAYARYQVQRDLDGTYSDTFGLPNGVTIAGVSGFQLAAPDDGNPLSRWHDVEILSLFGYDGATLAAPVAITGKITTEAAKATPVLHYDLVPPSVSSGLLDYLCTMNRPDIGTLPGRININTAPVHVIAAAIPPSLADPNIISAAPSGYSSLDLAQDIVNNRPYSNLGELLTKVPRMKQYDTGGTWAGENVGQQSIQDDIEERDWVLSNLANKFTVRSDVFTAYILVRLGENGPQRRMIAIFDRSNVWEPTDRPKLVALHPVPDPR